MMEKNRLQRPREKAAAYGIQSLSDEELLCLLLGSGQSNLQVEKIAQILLEKTESLAGFLEMCFEDLVQIEGIGPAKAWTLLGGVELTRRCYERNALNGQIGGKNALIKWMIMEYGLKKQEHFGAVFLNIKGKMISHKTLFIGTGSQAVIHPSCLVREACLAGAATVVIVHNHPSGDVSPSPEDVETTAQVQKALSAAGLNLADHIVVGGSSYFSFLEHRLLD